MVCRANWQRIALTAVILLAGCASEGAGRVVERRADGPAPVRDAAALRAAMLAGHNDARRAIGLAPLVWDDALAVAAQGYADTLARTRRFEHSHDRGAQGENLWTGTRGAYAYAEMIGHWVDERRMFRMAPTPNFSTTGKGADVAHYTQIVWRATTRVGCAIASNARDDYLVCRYTPPGNVVGQRPY